MKDTAVKKVTEPNKTENKIENVQEKASVKLSDVAEVIHNKTDEAQELLGEKVNNVEEIVRKKTYEASDFTQQKLEKANEIGHRAADLIDNSSQYIKQFDAQETKEKVVRTIKQKPELGIAAAGVFGLLIGFLVGRKAKN